MDNNDMQTVENRMIDNVPLVSPEMTVGDVRDMLTADACLLGTIDYIFVVDRNKVLVGVISIKEVLSCHEKVDVVKEVMKTDLVVASPETDQERVVYLALSNGIKAVPVVDDGMHFLGVVPFDEILKIFNHEAQSDVFYFGGIFHKMVDEYSTVSSSATVMIKSRLPWLVIGVFGGVLAASVISSFEETLSQLLVLASFIPVLVYMSDAVGTQSETLIIRALALDPHISLAEYFIREFKVAVILAIISGALISVAAVLGWGELILGPIVGISMILSIIAAVMISTFFPLIFRKFGFDPAVATGPFATMVSDIATLSVYFFTAVLILGAVN